MYIRRGPTNSKIDSAKVCTSDEVRVTPKSAKRLLRWSHRGRHGHQRKGVCQKPGAQKRLYGVQQGRSSDDERSACRKRYVQRESRVVCEKTVSRAVCTNMPSERLEGAFRRLRNRKRSQTDIEFPKLSISSEDKVTLHYQSFQNANVTFCWELVTKFSRKMKIWSSKKCKSFATTSGLHSLIWNYERTNEDERVVVEAASGPQAIRVLRPDQERHVPRSV